MWAAKCSARFGKREATIMSRIGKQPMSLPEGVTASLAEGTATLKGP